jgi:hypothetical protein
MQLATTLRLVATLALGTAIVPLATPAAAAEQVEAKARVDVTVKSTEGDSVHLAASHVAWDGSATLRKSADDHEHAVEISMRRVEDRVKVTLSYALDGAVIVTTQDLSATIATPVTIASPDGKSEVVFTVKAEAPRKKIEIDGGEDPISGV